MSLPRGFVITMWVSVLVCTMYEVACLTCRDGWYNDGSECQRCPQNCIFCNSEKYCLSCNNGYRGSACDIACTNCIPHTSCEKTTGYCQHGCKEGLSGQLCDKPCDQHCTSCDRQNSSLCLKCNGTYGRYCEKTCPSGCADDICHINNGTCFECKKGLHGIRCLCPNNCDCDTNGTCIKCNVELEFMCGSSCLEICPRGLCSKETRKCSNTTNDDSIKHGRNYILVLLLLLPIGAIGVVVWLFIYRPQTIREKCSRSSRISWCKICDTEKAEYGPEIQPMVTPEKEKEETILELELKEARGQSADDSNSQLTEEYMVKKLPNLLKNFKGLQKQKKGHKSRSFGKLDAHEIKVSDTSETNYIACKAPGKDLFTAFWQLVFEEGCKTVIMLEDDIKNEDQFWPSGKTPEQFDVIRVQLIRQKLNETCDVRDFMVSKAEEVGRTVRLFIFKAWTKALEKPNILKNFLQMVWLNSEGSRIVLCSDGRGRTGVYIVLEILMKTDYLKSSDKGESHIVKQCVEMLRKQRPNMIVNFDQYKLIYRIFKSDRHKTSEQVYGTDVHPPQPGKGENPSESQKKDHSTAERSGLKEHVNLTQDDSQLQSESSRKPVINQEVSTSQASSSNQPLKVSNECPHKTSTGLSSSKEEETTSMTSEKKQKTFLIGGLLKRSSKTGKDRQEKDCSTKPLLPSKRVADSEVLKGETNDSGSDIDRALPSVSVTIKNVVTKSKPTVPQKIEKNTKEGKPQQKLSTQSRESANNSKQTTTVV